MEDNNEINFKLIVVPSKIQVKKMITFDMNPLHEFWTLFKGIDVNHTARVLVE